jgi:CubicO group peptidase (beta-lactamase class C family)
MRAFATVGLSSLVCTVLGCSDGPGSGPPSPGPSADSVGTMNLVNGYVHLRLTLDNAREAMTFHYGLGYEAGYALPCAGDFDGDGCDTLALYDPAERSAVILDDNSHDATAQEIAFGTVGIPVCGDFDGDGVDTMQVYAESERIPVAGDFDGDGIDTIATFDKKTATFDVDGNVFVFGNAQSAPFAGDFDGDGVDTIGVLDPRAGTLSFRGADGAAVALTAPMPIPDGDIAGLPPLHIPIIGHWRDSGARAETTGHAWPTSTPAAENIDGALLEAAYAKARALPRLHSLLVVRHGKLVAEEYFHGFDRGMANNVQSVSKSMLSLLYGIAHKQGLYTSGTPAQQILPALGTDTARQGILVEHLLTMSAGLQWSEVYPLNAFEAAPDRLRYVWDQPVVAAPGTQFLYSTGLSYVAGAVLQEIVDERIDHFARRELFEPLGIQLHYWHRGDGVPHGGSAMHLLAARHGAHGRARAPPRCARRQTDRRAHVDRWHDGSATQGPRRRGRHAVRLLRWQVVDDR